jgi:hypothetical protein
MIERRFTVHEAAKVLQITPEAVRSRIQRGTLPKEKGKDGTVYVRLNVDQSRLIAYRTPDQTRSNHDQSLLENSPLIEALRGQVKMLRAELADWKEIVATRDEELRRKDHIIAALTERIPEFEPPSEPRETPETTSEDRGRGEAQEAKKHPLWGRRFFGA